MKKLAKSLSYTKIQQMLSRMSSTLFRGCTTTTCRITREALRRISISINTTTDDSDTPPTTEL